MRTDFLVKKVRNKKTATEDKVSPVAALLQF
jgi:hypothetical protein